MVVMLKQIDTIIIWKRDFPRFTNFVCFGNIVYDYVVHGRGSGRFVVKVVDTLDN